MSDWTHIYLLVQYHAVRIKHATFMISQPTAAKTTGYIHVCGSV